jgi:CRISPR-associated endonuclease Cas2
LAHDKEWQPVRLFPEDDDRQVLHVLEPGTRVGRTGEQIKILRGAEKKADVIPARQVGQVVLHRFSQISTQALHFCSDQKIGVHLVSGGGRYLGSFDARRGSIQRRIAQYGVSVQLSIFRVALSQRDREKLRWELARILKPEDAILLVGLCHRCCERVPLYNREGVWEEPQPSFRVI